MSRSNTIDLVGSCVLVEKDYPHRFLPDLVWEIQLRIDSPVSAPFLSDFLASSAGRRLLQSAAMGTSGSMKKLSMQRVRRLEIPIPPRLVQERWEHVRAVFERRLTCIASLIALKKQVKRSLAQRMLIGHQRFPEFVSDPWPTLPLRAVVEINPESLPSTTAGSFSFRYIDLSSIHRGRVLEAPRRVQFNASPSRARRVVRQYDVLLATVRPNLRGFGLVEEDAKDLVCSTGFAVLRAKTAADARYILEFLFSELFQRQAQARLVGSSFPALNSTDIDEIVLPWPSSPEREKVALLLGLTSQELDLLEDLYRSSEAQRRAAMQRLLSGDIPALDPAA